MFSICKRAVEVLYPEVRREWKFAVCCGDHTYAAKNAFLQHNPEGQWLACWVHVYLHCTKKAKPWFTGTQNEKTVTANWFKVQVKMLHACRTANQMRRRWGHVSDVLRAQGNHLVQKWFDSTYMREDWVNWYFSASGVPTVCPNQNAVESYHNALKVLLTALSCSAVVGSEL